jgi:hypothetical protein
MPFLNQDLANALAQTIDGLHEDYDFTEGQPAAEIAPVEVPLYASPYKGAKTFAYHVLEARGNEVDTDDVQPMAKDALHEATAFSYDVKEFGLQKFDLKAFEVSDDVLDAFNSQVFGAKSNLADTIVRWQLDRARAIHAQKVRAAAEDQLDAASVSLADLTESVFDVTNEIDLFGQADTILLSRRTAKALSQSVAVRTSPLTGTSADFRQAGAGSLAMLADYFQEVHGLKLVIDNSRWLDYGERKEIWSNTGVICAAGAERRCLGTFISRPNALVDTFIRELTNRRQRGIEVVGSTLFGVHAMNPELGRYITIDLGPESP